MSLHKNNRILLDCVSRNTLATPSFHVKPRVSLEEKSWFNIQLKNDGLITESIESYILKDASPIPTTEDRESYCPNSDFNYWCTGLSDYLKVMKVVKETGTNLERYFDFGCATGRVIRQFAHQSDVKEIWGSDINENHIKWVSSYLPKNIIPIHNHTFPTLPMEDNYFDVVTAFSVFTHITSFETAWLCELRRLLKPRGIAYITLHMDDSWKYWKELNQERNNLLKTNPEFAQSEFRDKVSFVSSHEGPYHGMVFHTKEYVENVWGRYFDIFRIIPKYHGGANQAAIILQKP